MQTSLETSRETINDVTRGLFKGLSPLEKSVTESDLSDIHAAFTKFFKLRTENLTFDEKSQVHMRTHAVHFVQLCLSDNHAVHVQNSHVTKVFPLVYWADPSNPCEPEAAPARSGWL